MKGEKGEQMRGLSGDRFLKRFAGDLKHRWHHPAAPFEEQNAGVGAEITIGFDRAAEQAQAEEAADAIDKPNGEEPNKKDEIAPKDDLR